MPYEAEIARAVQRVVVERLMTLAITADMPQVRAIATPEAAAARAAAADAPHDQRAARPRTRRCSRRTSSGSSIGRSRRRRAPTFRPRRPARRSAIRGWTGWDGWRRSAGGTGSGSDGFSGLGGSGLSCGVRAQSELDVAPRSPRALSLERSTALRCALRVLFLPARAPRTSRPAGPRTARSSRRRALPSAR